MCCVLKVREFACLRPCILSIAYVHHLCLHLCPKKSTLLHVYMRAPMHVTTSTPIHAPASTSACPCTCPKMKTHTNAPSPSHAHRTHASVCTFPCARHTCQRLHLPMCPQVLKCPPTPENQYTFTLLCMCRRDRRVYLLLFLSMQIKNMLLYAPEKIH